VSYSLINDSPVITIANNGFFQTNINPRLPATPKVSFLNANQQPVCTYSNIKIIPSYTNTKIALTLFDGNSTVLEPGHTNTFMPIVFDRPDNAPIEYHVVSVKPYFDGQVQYSLDGGQT
jgi:hypothetical protein